MSCLTEENLEAQLKLAINETRQEDTMIETESKSDTEH